MCALSFERCIGAQCDLDKKKTYELRLTQFIGDVNKHRFYVVDKKEENIMEIDVIND